MKKRLLASLLSVCLIIGLFPVTALAEDETPDGETSAVCAQLAGCVEGAHDEACPLYAAPEEPEAAPETEQETETGTEAENVYTLHLTHYFRFTVDGKNRNVRASEEISLTEADFEDGVCDLNRFAQSAEQLTVTEAKPVLLEDFDENGVHLYGARIVYAVSSGWRMVYAGEASSEGVSLRTVFNGALGDYEFVPANVVRIKMNYKYSNTGGLAGIDVASPDTVEAIPTEQTDGTTGETTYKVTWELPTVDGFRIVLDPSELNKYVVSPPTGNETEAGLAAKLENGDFDVDIANHTIYYYQEQSSQDHTIQHPTYQNRYSTEYNQAWNAARTLTVKDSDDNALYTATAVGDNTIKGATPLENPKLEVTLTEEQLAKVLEDGTDLEITVYYRRNATWYTVNHWVPKALSGLDDTTGYETKTGENGTEYVRLDQETLQGRVGALTRAEAKTDAGTVYDQLQSVGFSQELIENTDTVVDIYYAAAESYRVIFDTDYTYIPRQQVTLGENVDFTSVTAPSRTGYTFAGWRYLNKNATPDANGNYAETDYTDVGTDAAGSYTLTVNNDLIAAAKLTESGGVLALHLYPKWTPDTTNVRVILWTEDLTGTDDVQATASGGNTTYYDTKYQNYSTAPVTHSPQLGTSDSHYSNAGSFTVTVNTDSSLLKEGQDKALLDTIQTQVTNQFKTAMGQASGIDVDQFYTQAAFEIVHEEDSGINYNATTASADGKTTIYVYFTRNIYTLQFHYYGSATSTADNNTTSDYFVAINTNGYSYNGADQCAPNGTFNFAYNNRITVGGVAQENRWRVPSNVNQASDMPVPQTITITAKYGADLWDVWPVAQTDEQVNIAGNPTNDEDQYVKMISWATTDGAYRDNSLVSTSANYQEPTIMGVYAAMGSEIIADPANTDTVHHLVAYWSRYKANYFRNNHCYEVPELNVNDNSIQKVSIYNNDTTNEQNFLYLVPTDNKAIAKYEFNDLMRVSYSNGTITYGTDNGNYYAVRAYTNNGTTKYYAVARQVETVSTNTIDKQNPSARLHMTRANTTADHSTEYQNTGTSYGEIGTVNNPYDLYFYYDRDRYTITYMAPSNNITTDTEVTLGTVTLPYGALVTQEKYGFELNYQDKNTNNKYGWTPADETAVCPDRHTDGKAVWKFKGWGLGPAGVNMQWTVNEDAETEAQAGDAFAIESNMRLYAIWDTPTYTVTFHLNDGTVNGASGDIVEDVDANTRYSASGTIPRPLRNGYTLTGWYVADENGNIAEGAATFDFDQIITEDKHVAALWTSNTTEVFHYTAYYVTAKLRDGDTGNHETVQIDEKGEIVQTDGTIYYVLGKDEMRNQSYVSNMVVNLMAKNFESYRPTSTIQTLAPTQADQTYSVIFYYDAITAASHTVRFVEAGTETGANPTVVKEMTVKADQTVVTPQSAAATELYNKGYALVNKDNAGNGYTEVKSAGELKWIDENGDAQETTTLAGDQIPDTITYLVQPISYTITYQNAANSPAAAEGALNAVTAAANTSVASANGKNPTLYTTKDTFTATNPARVYENGKWYRFGHWNLQDDTASHTILTVDKGTVGNLTFIATWVEVTATDLGSLTVSKTVAGDAGDKNQAFNFTVTLDDTAVTGEVGGVTFTNGKATFTLKDGESKTISGLLANTTYTVTETAADGYVTTKTGDTGTITANQTAEAKFTNTKNSTPVDPGTGNLTVSKTVTGNAGETNRNFNFTVTLGDNTVNGTFGGMTFTGGKATFTLKHNESKKAENLPAGITYTVAETEANQDGYTTTSRDASGTITKDTTVTATFTNNKTSGGGGDGGDDNYAVIYHANYGSDRTKTERYDQGDKVTVKDYDDTKLPEREGYIFDGWNTRENGRGTDYDADDTFKMPARDVDLYAQWVRDVSDPDDTGVSDLLNTDDHIQYLYGYPDNTFGPTRNMTRAEAAQMFFNLLRDQDVRKTVSFTDVNGTEWFADAVHTMASLGVLKGYPDGSFQPNKPITRAEFTTMAMQFTNLDQSGNNSFSDVSMADWFYTFVVGASKYGWISGYPDGTFKPNANITRAEVTSIVNNMLGRYADEDYVDNHPNRINSFTDLSDSYWAYYPIMEATNEHDYTKGYQSEDWSNVSWRAKR